MRIILVYIIGIVIGVLHLSADTPLKPPAKLTVTSPDGSITAISDPKSWTTIIETTKTKEQLWQIPCWSRWIFAANDGKHIVTGYDGMNLIPVKYDKNMVLFSFWREGKQIGKVTLKEFVPEESILKRTVSHYYWGIIRKIDDKGRLVVERADKKIFLFDITTGKSVK